LLVFAAIVQPPHFHFRIGGGKEKETPGFDRQKEVIKKHRKINDPGRPVFPME
jgi:hypothetical protein